MKKILLIILLVIPSFFLAQEKTPNPHHRKRKKEQVQRRPIDPNDTLISTFLEFYERNHLEEIIIIRTGNKFLIVPLPNNDENVPKKDTSK